MSRREPPYKFRPVPSVTPVDIPVWRKRFGVYSWVSPEFSQAKSKRIMIAFDNSGFIEDKMDNERELRLP